jgi:hypothetical protein
MYHHTIHIYHQINATISPVFYRKNCYHHGPKVKPEAATAVPELLMMGLRTPETC